MADRLQWGIIGLGRIARSFATALRRSRTGTLLAAGSRSKETADQFGREFDLPATKRYGTYDHLLADDDVEAVYIATPHPMHAEWGIKAAEAGKHVLCEKPIAINHRQATMMIEAAARNDVFLMEAFMYRCHPQTQKILDLIDEGAIGEVRVIHATFAYHTPYKPEHRIFAKHLGGGGILDLGCYPVSTARLIAGRALGRDFAEPTNLQALGHLAETGVDGWTIANLRFESNILAQLTTSVQMQMDNNVRIWGSEGNMIIPSAWRPSLDNDKPCIHLTSRGKKTIIPVTSDLPLYGMEADVVARDLSNRQARPPAMTWDDTLGNMLTLDRWREAIGYTQDEEA